jgi:hypothetical protein
MKVFAIRMDLANRIKFYALYYPVIIHLTRFG